MSPKEIGVLVLNVAALVLVFACIPMHYATFAQAVAAAALLLVPSGAGPAAELAKRVFASMKSDGPSGPGPLGILLSLVGIALVSSACAELFGSSPASPSSPACANLSVEECAAAYQAELARCTAQSPTFNESVQCEQLARIKYRRAPRAMYAHDAAAPSPAADAGSSSPSLDAGGDS